MGAKMPISFFGTSQSDQFLEFYADQPLKSFMKGVLASKTKDLLSHSFPSLAEEILILKRKDSKLYCAKLLEFNHENLLKPLACYNVYDELCVADDEEKFSCILFEDRLGCLHELGNLLFVPRSEGWLLSSLGRKYVFEVAKTLDFLRVNKCFHGALSMANIYVCDLTDTDCKVKLGGLKGLLNCGDFELEWLGDLYNFGLSLEEILNVNDKIPHPVLKDYVVKLKSNSPATFLFSHPLWLNLPRKKSLILELATIENGPVMSESYWPSDKRLEELTSIDGHEYPKTIWGLTNLLKDMLLHPRYTIPYKGDTKDFGHFLESVESRDPCMWIKLVEVAAVMMKFGWGRKAEEVMYNGILTADFEWPQE